MVDPHNPAEEVAATTMWTAVAKEGALDELDELVGNITDEELDALAREASEEARDEIAERVRPYQTRVTRETLMRTLG
jgi:Mg/Co/Ni transporter MgtE